MSISMPQNTIRVPPNPVIPKQTITDGSSIPVLDPPPDIYEIHYQTPLIKDMVIGLVFFNPAKSKRMLMNYFYTINKLSCAKIPYYTMELVFENREPEIIEAFHVRARTFLFQKERLCRLLEERIPKSYTKILFMDTDLVFGNINWYTETSVALETKDAVQPFTTAVWLDLTYTKTILERHPRSTVDKKLPWTGHNNHPGFAWGFRRSWFHDHGFFEYSIVGGGDAITVVAWADSVSNPITMMKSAYTNAFEEYKAHANPRLDYVPGKIYHLHHGSLTNRQYNTRQRAIKDIDDVRDIIRINEFGVFECLDQKVADQIRDYFINRQDDGI